MKEKVVKSSSSVTPSEPETLFDWDRDEGNKWNLYFTVTSVNKLLCNLVMNLKVTRRVSVVWEWSSLTGIDRCVERLVLQVCLVRIQNPLNWTPHQSSPKIGFTAGLLDKLNYYTCNSVWCCHIFGLLTNTCRQSHHNCSAFLWPSFGSRPSAG